MNILISGASGFVGQALVPLLVSGGHDVVPLTRGHAVRGTVWDPERNRMDVSVLDGIDAVIHLAAESFHQRWTAEKRHRIMESRVAGTSLIARTAAARPRPPKVIISASSTHIYGHRGTEQLTEGAMPGEGFLSRVCQRWEASLRPAQVAGIRSVALRFGTIVDPVHGGPLARMAKVFGRGLGGWAGDGSQYLSWVSLTDALAAILFALDTEALSGPANVAAPGAVTAHGFATLVGRHLGRPARFAYPAWLTCLQLGEEKAREMRLASTLALPQALTGLGFTFRHILLSSALPIHGTETRISTPPPSETRQAA